MAGEIQVEVVYARADKQCLIAVSLPSGATVADAISGSSLRRDFPEENLDAMQVGIWGHLVDRSHVLSDGDRVEFFRPLELDPKEARRQLALLGQTMGKTRID